MRSPIAAILPLALVSSLLATSAATPGERFDRGGGGGRIVGPSRVAPPFGTHPHFVPRPFARRPFVHGGPVVVYSYPYGGPVYSEPSTYYTPPTYYVPAPAPAAPVPPPPPMPRVIEYPTGRYELRGDGNVNPYLWVWVPRPPTDPAVPPPPAAAPAPGASPPQEGPAPRRSVLYTWTDADGVLHWTDHAGDVPEEYKSRVRQRTL
jgi:hypothetical protein